MTKILLRALNAPALVLLVALAVALQSSLFSLWPLSYIKPDAVLLVVIWCALKRGFIEGGILTLMIADIAEIHSAAPQGLFLATYMVVYLAVRGADRLFVLPDISSFALVTVGSVAVAKFAEAAVLKILLSGGGRLWTHALISSIPEAIVEASFAYWIFRWLAQFDKLTFKNMREDSQADDGLQLDEAGI